MQLAEYQCGTVHGQRRVRKRMIAKKDDLVLHQQSKEVHLELARYSTQPTWSSWSLVKEWKVEFGPTRALMRGMARVLTRAYSRNQTSGASSRAS